MTGKGPVLIAGGGIGGLSLAIGLAHRGIPCRILERRTELVEAGAGIQLGPNAVGVLQRLGVASRLEPLVGKPQGIRVYQGRSGRLLTKLPLGSWIAERHGAPYWVAHRADLHTALLQTAQSLAQIEIVTGSEVHSFEPTGGGLEVHSADGRVDSGTVLVGADGIWSAIRRQLWPEAKLTYSGKTAARALVETQRAPAPFRDAVTGVWLSPAGHIVHYPVRGSSESAVVVILKEDWPGEGWGLPVDRLALLEKLHPFPGALTSFLALAEDWRCWPLYDPAPLKRWTRGPVTLLGDAAHPVLPFLAQGGALAIEDAETLAAALETWRSEPLTALAHYERVRQPRAVRMQQESRRNGQIYHLPQPASMARDLALRAIPGQQIMARYDWIYGWKPEVPAIARTPAGTARAQ